MDKRILESVKEFYRNVKEQDFSLDSISTLEYFSDEQEQKNRFYRN